MGLSKLIDGVRERFAESAEAKRAIMRNRTPEEKQAVLREQEASVGDNTMRYGAAGPVVSVIKKRRNAKANSAERDATEKRADTDT